MPEPKDPVIKLKIKFNLTNILLGIFTVFLLLVNITWIKQDMSPPPWDQAWYLENSISFYYSFLDEGFIGLIKDFSHAFGIKAPLISLLPFPLYLLFNLHADTALMVNMISIVVFNIFLYKLVYLLRKNKNEALLSVIIAGTIPVIIGISRHFFVEYTFLTMITIWLYFLLKSEYYTKTKHVIYLGIIGGLGMLLKVLFPLYIFVPALLALKKGIENNKEKVFKNIGVIIILVLLFSSVWYVNNLKTIWNFLISASIGQVSNDYSIGSVFSWTTLSAYWKLLINFALSTYYFILLFVLLVLLALKKFFLRTFKIKQKKAYYFALGWFLFPFLVLSFGVNKEIRFIIPALPAIAILLSLLVHDVFSKRSQWIIMPLLIVFPVYSILYSSFDYFGGKDIKIKNYFLTAKYQPYIHPAKIKPWPIEQIITDMNDDHKENSSQPVMAMMMIGITEFNFNTFSYYARLMDSKIRYSGTPTDSLEWAKRIQRESKYIITKEGGDKGVEFVNRFTGYFKEKLKKGRLPYIKIKEFDLPDGSQSFIYKKIVE